MTYGHDKWSRGEDWVAGQPSKSEKCITITDFSYVYPDDGEVENVAYVPVDTRPDGSLANDYRAPAVARLIAAAPKMLVALENIIPYIEAAIPDDYVEGILTDDAEGEVSRDLREVKRIIRKAKGGW